MKQAALVLLLGASACHRPADSTVATADPAPPSAAATASAPPVAKGVVRIGTLPPETTTAWGREDDLPATADPGRPTGVSVKGMLPPEVVMRVVRQNLQHFERCYDDGLARDGRLAGTLDVKFAIGKDGNPSHVERDPRSTLSDPGVVACVTAAFAKVSFPAPASGVVEVVCPLNLEPAPVKAP